MKRDRHAHRIATAARLTAAVLSTVLGVVGLVGAAGTALAVDTVVTGLTGVATLHGETLSIADRLAPQAAQDFGDTIKEVQVETDDQSTCALLHGDRLLVEMAPNSKVRIRDDVDGLGAVVEIMRGEARVTTQRTREDPRVEVRTPSARIRPMTSIIHVEVDGTTGNSLVTSLAERALVVSADVAQKRSALLNSNQWVSVPRGDAPGTIKQVDPESAQKIADEEMMLVLRGTALMSASENEGRALLERIAAADMLSSVADPLPTPQGFAAIGSDELEPVPVCLPFLCDPREAALVAALRDPRPPGPPPCTGIPGEQCN
jgi:hypothetical protein